MGVNTSLRLVTTTLPKGLLFPLHHLAVALFQEAETKFLRIYKGIMSDLQCKMHHFKEKIPQRTFHLQTYL